MLKSGGDALREGGLTVVSSRDPLDVGPALLNDSAGSQAARRAFWADLPRFPAESEYFRHHVGVLVEELSEPLVQATPVDGGRSVLWWGPNLSESLFVARLVERAASRNEVEDLWVVDRHLDSAGGPFWVRTADQLLDLARRPRRFTAREIDGLARTYASFCRGDLAGFLSASGGEQPFLSIHDRLSDRETGLSPVDRLLLVAARASADVRVLVGDVIGRSSAHALLWDVALYWRISELLTAGHLRVTRRGRWPRVVSSHPEVALPVRPIGQSWSVEVGTGRS